MFIETTTKTQRRDTLRRVKALCSALVCRISGRRSVLAELEELPENILLDIGILQADVRALRKVPMRGDGLKQLVERFRERGAACNLTESHRVRTPMSLAASKC